MSKLDAIKAKQLAEAAAGGPNPYAAEAEQPAASPTLSSLAHYQAALAADLASLKNLKILDEKQAAKRGMLPTYAPLIDEYITQGHDYPNDVAVQVMIWLMDVGDVEQGLDLAFELIKRKQRLPDKFARRDIETFVCDAIYDWANDLLKKDQSASPYLDTVVEVIESNTWDLSPPVASKVYAMLAKHKMREGQYQTVIDLCDKAESVNPDGAGVKKLREQAISKRKT